MRDHKILRDVAVPVVDQVVYYLFDRVAPDVGEEYEILVLVVPHEDIGLAQGSSDALAESVHVLVEFRIPLAVCGIQCEQDFASAYVMSDDVSDDIAVNGRE